MELDKRQRIISNVSELVKTYIDKDIDVSKKSQMQLNSMNTHLFNSTSDLLRFVNNYIIDAQSNEDMYISAKNTSQDIYRGNNQNNDNSSNSVPLFRNYRINGHATSSSSSTSGKEQIHTDLKKIIAHRSKKKKYISQKKILQI
jgi:hypothetical protein